MKQIHVLIVVALLATACNPIPETSLATSAVEQQIADTFEEDSLPIDTVVPTPAVEVMDSFQEAPEPALLEVPEQRNVAELKTDKLPNVPKNSPEEIQKPIFRVTAYDGMTAGEYIFTVYNDGNVTRVKEDTSRTRTQTSRVSSEEEMNALREILSKITTLSETYPLTKVTAVEPEKKRIEIFKEDVTLTTVIDPGIMDMYWPDELKPIYPWMNEQSMKIGYENTPVDDQQVLVVTINEPETHEPTITLYRGGRVTNSVFVELAETESYVDVTEIQISDEELTALLTRIEALPSIEEWYGEPPVRETVQTRTHWRATIVKNAIQTHTGSYSKESLPEGIQELITWAQNLEFDAN